MAKSSLKVLVVDDDAEICRLLDRSLSGAGYAVYSYSNGKDGLATAQNTVFDLALIDYDMPEPNGLEVLLRLKKIQPNCIRLLISGGLDVPAAVHAVNKGEATKIVSKPFTGEELLATVREALDMRRRLGEQFMWAEAMDRSNDEVHLRDCFEQGQLKMAIQPMQSTASGEFVAHEALLRSENEVLSNPLLVIAAAEKLNRLAQLASLVATEAARLFDVLQDTSSRLFVNLHPSELEDPNGLLGRAQALAPFADRVVFEITERSRMRDIALWRESISGLREAGFSVAVDDLGAGYSSLSMLAELKPEFMKIDMSIVRDCDKDDHKRRLIELLTGFATSANATLIAEGIETQPEAECVRECGVHWVQGYFFGKPYIPDGSSIK